MVDASYNKPGNLRRGLKWRDIMVKFSGPVISNLNRVFMGDWYIKTGELLEDSPPRVADPVELGDLLDCQVLPRGPGFGEENNLQVFIALTGTASKRISVTSARITRHSCARASESSCSSRRTFCIPNTSRSTTPDCSASPRPCIRRLRGGAERGR